MTIGGASAGGASVDLHLSAYGGRDDGLFHAAAAESQSFAPQLTVEEAQYQYDGLVQRVGCVNASDTLTCLRDVDIKVIVENNINIRAPDGAGKPPIYMWSNVIDGNFTTDYTYNLFSQGKFVKVPAIFGYVLQPPVTSSQLIEANRDDTNEGTIFTPAQINSTTAMNSFLQDQFVKLTAADLDQIDQYYPEAEQFPGKGTFWRAAANAYGEMRYICPGIYISSMVTEHGEEASYNYQYVLPFPQSICYH